MGNPVCPEGLITDLQVDGTEAFAQRFCEHAVAMVVKSRNLGRWILRSTRLRTFDQTSIADESEYSPVLRALDHS